MKPTGKTVQGWAWYAAKFLSSKAKGCPFDGLDGRQKVALLCPVRSSTGIGNRFTGDTHEGWLILTSTPVPPEVSEEWQVEPAELGAGFVAGSVRLSRVVWAQPSRWGPVQECILEAAETEGPPVLVPGPVPAWVASPPETGRESRTPARPEAARRIDDSPPGVPSRVQGCPRHRWELWTSRGLVRARR